MRASRRRYPHRPSSLLSTLAPTASQTRVPFAPAAPRQNVQVNSRARLLSCCKQVVGAGLRDGAVVQLASQASRIWMNKVTATSSSLSLSSRRMMERCRRRWPFGHCWWVPRTRAAKATRCPRLASSSSLSSTQSGRTSAGKLLFGTLGAALTLHFHFRSRFRSEFGSRSRSHSRARLQCRFPNQPL